MATYDIHYQILPLAEQTSERVYGFGFVSAVGVRGPQKLINRWVKCFMTPQGSDLFEPAYGTGFPDLIGSNIQSTSDIIDVVSLAIQDCNEQIRRFETTNLTPIDERLGAATILRILEDGDDGFQLWIGITNAAGLQTPVLLPSTSTRS
jgi:hypothetical protein